MSTVTAPTDAAVEFRHAEVRAVDLERREVSGIAVPWGQVADIGGYYREVVERGAVQDSSDALAFYGHQTPVGRVTRAEDTEAGWEVTVKLSETPTGDEAYTLARDGVLTHFSIGFVPGEHRDEVDAEGVITRTRTRIKVREVSLVPFPAYQGATVAQVRAADHTNPEEVPVMGDTVSRADLDEVRTVVEDVERRMATFSTVAPVEAAPQFRSIGHLVKALASGDELATRAYEGAVSGDTVLKDGWIGNFVEIIRKRRPVIEAFGGMGPLPAEGMGVEFAVLEGDTTQAGVQSGEGEDLLFGKLSITTQTAPVVTIGGWSSLSRQAIERASISVLDTTFEALVERYATASEVYVRGILNAAIADATATALAEVEADLTTQDGIVAGVLDLVEHFETAGRALDGVFVDKATFLALYGVEATDRVLQVSGQAADKVGTLSVQTASGSVAGLPFRLLPNATAGTVVAYDATALRALESGGAPTRLQDDNVVNLSKDFSVYGYVSAAITKRAGLVKVVEPEA